MHFDGTLIFHWTHSNSIFARSWKGTKVLESSYEQSSSVRQKRLNEAPCERRSISESLTKCNRLRAAGWSWKKIRVVKALLCVLYIHLLRNDEDFRYLVQKVERTPPKKKSEHPFIIKSDLFGILWRKCDSNISRHIKIEFSQQCLTLDGDKVLTRRVNVSVLLTLTSWKENALLCSWKLAVWALCSKIFSVWCNCWCYLIFS